MTVTYESDNIIIEETPNGCFITDKLKGATSQLGELADINAMINSLHRLKLIWYGKGESH